MIELFRLIFIFTICFVILCPFLMFIIKVSNRFSKPTFEYSRPKCINVQKSINVPSRSKSKRSININSSVLPSNPAIKEFTLPDGSKVAIDVGKVNLEEKQVFE